MDSTLDLEETPLSGNQAIDAETAAAGGLVLVTEDCLEARILDCLEAPARCGVYALLAASGCGLHALGHVAAKLSEWGADPCVDINVAESASSIEFRDVRPIRGTVKGGEAAGAALAWRHVN